MKWTLLLLVLPLTTGLAASVFWRASGFLQVLGSGLLGAIAATLICIPFLPLEGWGAVGAIALFVTPTACAPAAVAGAALGAAARTFFQKQA